MPPHSSPPLRKQASGGSSGGSEGPWRVPVTSSATAQPAVVEEAVSSQTGLGPLSPASFPVTTSPVALSVASPRHHALASSVMSPGALSVHLLGASAIAELMHRSADSSSGGPLTSATADDAAAQHQQGAANAVPISTLLSRLESLESALAVMDGRSRHAAAAGKGVMAPRGGGTAPEPVQHQQQQQLMTHHQQQQQQQPRSVLEGAGASLQLPQPRGPASPQPAAQRRRPVPTRERQGSSAEEYFTAPTVSAVATQQPRLFRSPHRTQQQQQQVQRHQVISPDLLNLLDGGMTISPQYQQQPPAATAFGQGSSSVGAGSSSAYADALLAPQSGAPASIAAVGPLSPLPARRRVPSDDPWLTTNISTGVPASAIAPSSAAAAPEGNRAVVRPLGQRKASSASLGGGSGANDVSPQPAAQLPSLPLQQEQLQPTASARGRRASTASASSNNNALNLLPQPAATLHRTAPASVSPAEPLPAAAPQVPRPAAKQRPSQSSPSMISAIDAQAPPSLRSSSQPADQHQQPREPSEARRLRSRSASVSSIESFTYEGANHSSSSSLYLSGDMTVPELAVPVGGDVKLRPASRRNSRAEIVAAAVISPPSAAAPIPSVSSAAVAALSPAVPAPPLSGRGAIGVLSPPPQKRRSTYSSSSKADDGDGDNNADAASAGPTPLIYTGAPTASHIGHTHRLTTRAAQMLPHQQLGPAIASVGANHSDGDSRWDLPVGDRSIVDAELDALAAALAMDGGASSSLTIPQPQPSPHVLLPYAADAAPAAALSVPRGLLSPPPRRSSRAASSADQSSVAAAEPSPQLTSLSGPNQQLSSQADRVKLQQRVASYVPASSDVQPREPPSSSVDGTSVRSRRASDASSLLPIAASATSLPAPQPSPELMSAAASPAEGLPAAPGIRSPPPHARRRKSSTTSSGAGNDAAMASNDEAAGQPLALARLAASAESRPKQSERMMLQQRPPGSATAVSSSSHELQTPVDDYHSTFRRQSCEALDSGGGEQLGLPAPHPSPASTADTAPSVGSLEPASALPSHPSLLSPPPRRRHSQAGRNDGADGAAPQLALETSLAAAQFQRERLRLQQRAAQALSQREVSSRPGFEAASASTAAASGTRRQAAPGARGSDSTALADPQPSPPLAAPFSDARSPGQSLSQDGAGRGMLSPPPQKRHSSPVSFNDEGTMSRAVDLGPRSSGSSDQAYASALASQRQPLPTRSSQQLNQRASVISTTDVLDDPRHQLPLIRAFHNSAADSGLLAPSSLPQPTPEAVTSSEPASTVSAPRGVLSPLQSKRSVRPSSDASGPVPNKVAASASLSQTYQRQQLGSRAVSSAASSDGGRLTLGLDNGGFFNDGGGVGVDQAERSFDLELNDLASHARVAGVELPRPQPSPPLVAGLSAPSGAQQLHAPPGILGPPPARRGRAPPPSDVDDASALVAAMAGPSFDGALFASRTLLQRNTYSTGASGDGSRLSAQPEPSDVITAIADASASAVPSRRSASADSHLKRPFSADATLQLPQPQATPSLSAAVLQSSSSASETASAPASVALHSPPPRPRLRQLVEAHQASASTAPPLAPTATASASLSLSAQPARPALTRRAAAEHDAAAPAAPPVRSEQAATVPSRKASRDSSASWPSLAMGQHPVSINNTAGDASALPLQLTSQPAPPLPAPAAAGSGSVERRRSSGSIFDEDAASGGSSGASFPLLSPSPVDSQSHHALPSRVLQAIAVHSVAASVNIETGLPAIQQPQRRAPPQGAHLHFDDYPPSLPSFSALNSSFSSVAADPLPWSGAKPDKPARVPSRSRSRSRQRDGAAEAVEAAAQQEATSPLPGLYIANRTVHFPSSTSVAGEGRGSGSSSSSTKALVQLCNTSDVPLEVKVSVKGDPAFHVKRGHCRISLRPRSFCRLPVSFRPQTSPLSAGGVGGSSSTGAQVTVREALLVVQAREVSVATSGSSIPAPAALMICRAAHALLMGAAAVNTL